ncbi:hypothetical protein FHL15_009725 [Xylaria flabelliformis]|uniref:Uncharacterized protein n=1 Tax=Xylaria flabelliformis TaxID=2512241 RepID=A0A553HNC4_9PEZI|nr:hypothetical protein FHL15_009725 [Xylaria flabelliformis]
MRLSIVTAAGSPQLCVDHQPAMSAQEEMVGRYLLHDMALVTQTRASSSHLRIRLREQAGHISMSYLRDITVDQLTGDEDPYNNIQQVRLIDVHFLA